MSATLENMTAKGFINRIEDAREINHEESRKELLGKIYRELKPVREEMLKALGKEAESMLALGDHEDDPGEYVAEVEVSTLDRVDDVAIYTTSLGDLRNLREVYALIEGMKLQEAHDRAQMLDTSVRERIPESVWEFFESAD